MKTHVVKIIWFLAGAAAVFAYTLTGMNVRATSVLVETTVVQAAPQADATGGSSQLQYQGRLLDPTTNQPKPNGVYTIVFNLYNVADGGSSLWTETKNVTVNQGLFSTFLGDTALFPAGLFNGQELYLGVAVGGDPEMTPRQRITSVAYAIFASTADYANKADTLDGQDSTQFAPAAHTHDGSAINSGAVSTDHFSAYDDLAAEGKIGAANGQVAAGNHVHPWSALQCYFQFVTFKAPSTTALAYAFINFDGSKSSGTANVSSTWNASAQWYEISIAGEGYFWVNYTTIVTPIDTTGCESAIASTGSVSGLLLIGFRANPAAAVERSLPRLPMTDAERSSQ